MTEKKQLKRKFERAAISQHVQIALEKLHRGEPLTEKEDKLILSSSETAAILSCLKRQPVSVRYLPQMIRDGRLQPIGAAPTGNGYLYSMRQVRSILFKKPGRPKNNYSPG